MPEQISKTKKIALAGMFLAAGLVIGRFRFFLPCAGVSVIKLSFSGPIYKFAAILLGASYGGIIGALADFIGATTNPIGGYIWMFTVVAFIKEFFIGFLWQISKKIYALKNKTIARVIFSVLAPDFIASLLNTYIMKIYSILPDGAFMLILKTRLIKEFFSTVFNIVVLVIMINIYKKIFCAVGGQNEF